MTAPKNALALGAGWLLGAPLGTSFPTNTVSGSVFTDSWPVGWFLWGVTREGHEFTNEIETEDITAAEYLDRLQVVTTGRSAGIAFDVMQVHLTNLKRALNGGTLSTSGSGATLLTTYTPPQPGAEVRSMIGWESTDSTERLVMPQAFQTGSLTINRRKGADNASFPLSFAAEIDNSGFPWYAYGAGTVRG